MTELFDQSNALTTEDKGNLICELLKSMTASDLKGLVSKTEDTFGVKLPEQIDWSQINPPVQEVEEEPTDFDVIITGFDSSKKISLIKEVRAQTGLGLRDAKLLVDEFPSPVKQALDKEEAERLKSSLEENGAEIELRPAEG